MWWTLKDVNGTGTLGFPNRRGPSTYRMSPRYIEIPCLSFLRCSWFSGFESDIVSSRWYPGEFSYRKKGKYKRTFNDLYPSVPGIIYKHTWNLLYIINCNTSLTNTYLCNKQEVCMHTPGSVLDIIIKGACHPLTARTLQSEKMPYTPAWTE